MSEQHRGRVLTEADRDLAAALPGYTTALTLRRFEQAGLPQRDAVRPLEQAHEVDR